MCTGRATALSVAAALLACLSPAGAASAIAAGASEQASLSAGFSPDRLGASTTISFGFHLQTAEGTAPPPLASIVLRMPAGMNYALTTLGLAICRPAVLAAQGIEGCPPNSRLGSGSALVELPFGTGAGYEIPEVQAVVGPPNQGNLVVLFYADGRTPVVAQLVFGGEVRADSGIFGSQLATTVPPIASVPGGPDVSVISLNATIGPAGLTYYKHVHGMLKAFHPLGIGVPEHCPAGGFPFGAAFVFQDGSRASASTTVPCPPPVRRRRK
jgi:hypothetical protein